MNEKIVMWSDFFTGTLAANVTRYIEFPWPCTFVKAKGLASNDSSATFALSGASTMSITAGAIGDSGDPAAISPASGDVAYEAADSLITMLLDFDGASGTAAENVHIQAWFLIGED